MVKTNFCFSLLCTFAVLFRRKTRPLIHFSLLYIFAEKYFRCSFFAEKRVHSNVFRSTNTMSDLFYEGTNKSSRPILRGMDVGCKGVGEGVSEGGTAIVIMIASQLEDFLGGFASILFRDVPEITNKVRGRARRVRVRVLRFFYYRVRVRVLRFFYYRVRVQKFRI
jgi:hypothetical protein